MYNLVVLQKQEDGTLLCRQLNETGKTYLDEAIKGWHEGDVTYWEDGGTILMEELEEILNKEI